MTNNCTSLECAVEAGIVVVSLHHRHPVLGPEEQAASREIIAILRNCLNSLPTHQRSLLIAHYGIDTIQRSLSEIGIELGISKEAVRKRLSKAEEMLMQRLPTYADFV
jgi:RNA polymerase sigma factor (sigma-70 family)